MNIFVTDDDPRVSAINLDNKRVIKMILESAQMLCTAIQHHGGMKIKLIGHTKKGKPKYDYYFDNGVKAYKPTHVNHPCNVWCRETKMNYGWLLMHLRALFNEYTYRTGKTHATEYMYDYLVDGIKYVPDGDLTPYANCAARQDMGINYKHIKDVPFAYQLYLVDRWANDKLIPKWTNRSRPF